MKTVELTNNNGRRKFTIWGGVAVHTNANGSEYRKELNAGDLFNGTLKDNVKALTGVDTLEVNRFQVSTNENSTNFFIELSNKACHFNYIELKGWEL